MRFVFTTLLSLPGWEGFASQIDAMDATFSARYKKEYNLGEQGTSYGLKGETHWDGDKYNLFFVEIPPEQTDVFQKILADSNVCYMAAPANEKYEVSEGIKPLYIKPSVVEAYKRQGADYSIPQNIRRRQQGFKPKECNPV